ncbi:MAG: peptidylprolyl isomerase [Candidatus Micrarchaeota archaeon]|nr:peptidylprolyl isomerase [Candidatus Micrarchaeota archaeon]
MASIRKGDLLRFEYTGKVASTGAVFETTDEQIAKKSGIFDPSEKYGARLAVFGNGSMIAGLEEALLAAQIGKQSEFLIPPEKAFGKKMAQLVRIVPEKQFARQGIKPAVGMLVTLDGIPALVKSITSGRVVVDFNHPLAGESVIYSIKLHEVISDDKKKLEAILASAQLKAEISQKGGGWEVKFQQGADKEKLQAAKEAISRVVPAVSFANA